MESLYYLLIVVTQMAVLQNVYINATKLSSPEASRLDSAVQLVDLCGAY